MKKRFVCLGMMVVTMGALTACHSIEEIVQDPNAMFEDAGEIGSQVQSVIEDNMIEENIPSIPAIPTIPEEVTQVVQDGLQMISEHVAYGDQELKVSLNNENGWNVKFDDGQINIFTQNGEGEQPYASVDVISKEDYERMVGEITKEMDYISKDGMIEVNDNGISYYLKMINDEVGYRIEATDAEKLEEVVQSLDVEVEEEEK